MLASSAADLRVFSGTQVRGNYQSSKRNVTVSGRLWPFCDLRARGGNRPVADGRVSTERAHSRHYSITWSARASIELGILMPSALAVFMLITNSNLVGCSTGKSEGFAPLNILSTKTAAR